MKEMSGVVAGGAAGSPEGQERTAQISQGQEGAPPPYWAVLNKFSGTQNWPHQTIVLPGTVHHLSAMTRPVHRIH